MKTSKEKVEIVLTANFALNQILQSCRTNLFPDFMESPSVAPVREHGKLAVGVCFCGVIKHLAEGFSDEGGTR